jgi:hypothetical protein
MGLLFPIGVALSLEIGTLRALMSGNGGEALLLRSCKISPPPDQPPCSVEIKTISSLSSSS